MQLHLLDATLHALAKASCSPPKGAFPGLFLPAEFKFTGSRVEIMASADRRGGGGVVVQGISPSLPVSQKPLSVVWARYVLCAGNTTFSGITALMAGDWLTFKTGCKCCGNLVCLIINSKSL